MHKFLDTEVCILYIVGINFIYYWSTFLYIVGVVICAPLHNYIYCWSILLYIIRTLLAYIIGTVIPPLTFVGTQFYTLFYALFGLGRHDLGTIIPQKGGYFGFYTLFLY